VLASRIESAGDGVPDSYCASRGCRAGSLGPSLGGVVTQGQQVLRIVPTDGGIEIEAVVANQNVGFVEVGQQVENAPRPDTRRRPRARV
jgi:HlyD family secretion protein